MEPLISVIVPVYKVEDYLQKCIESILGQTYHNLELILVDDGSPDRCGRICDEYAEKDIRVRVIHKKNEGQAIARNAGLKLARGEYLTFVDSDDWLDLGLYENAMRKSPFDIAVFGCTYVDEKGEIIRVSRVPTDKDELYWSSDVEDLEKVIGGSLFGYACNKIYHRNVLESTEMSNVKLREDLLFYIDICSKRDHVTLIDHVGYFYLQRSESTLRKAYFGEIPNLEAVAEKMMVLHPLLPLKDNRRIANGLIKTYLCDAMYKYIFMNQMLQEKDAIIALRKLFKNSKLRKTLRIYCSDVPMHLFLTVCWKLRLSSIFYYLMKRKWNLGSVD